MLRTRAIVASILAVLTGILLLLTTVGWWAERYFLDSARFTTTADEIIAEEDVQRALTTAITDEISQASGRDLRIAEPFISTVVTGVVQSDQFQTVFDAAVLRLHRAVVDGDARNAVLSLSETVDRVRNALEPIAPGLAEDIPEGKRLRIVVLDKTQLDTVYDTVNLVEDLVVLLTILTVACLAAAIAISPRRWRTLALAGWVVVGVFVVRLLALWLGRGIVGGFAERDEYRDAAESAYKVVVHGLVVQTLVILVLGLLVAPFAGWTDRHGGWAAVTGTVRQGATWTKQQIPTRTPAPDAAADEGAPPAAVGVAPTPSAPRAVVEGALAPRLPSPRGAPRAAHWWRAAGLLVLGLFAVLSPGSLTTVVVVLLGLAALYLALTEAVAAWGSPKAGVPDAPPGDRGA
jgi:hypothetical protein